MGQLFSVNELSVLLSISRQKIISWIEKEGLHVLIHKVGSVRKREYQYIDSEEFWKWAENHKSVIKVSTIPPHVIPNEPEWVKDERVCRH